MGSAGTNYPECNTKMLALLPLFLLLALSSASPVTKGVCGDFLEGACDLSENNILDHNRYTDTPAECQDLCSQNSQCHFFTHFSTQCYLLAECGNSEHCTGCVSGPTSPPFGSCPWPPSPTDHGTLTTTPTTTPTTTTQQEGNCEDIHLNSQCDWNYGLITWYEQVMTGSECQYICKNVNGAKYLSSYNEGHHAEHGYCGCFSSCAWPSTSQCHNKCATHETHSYEDEMEETVNLADLESAEIFGGEVSVEVEVWDGPPGPRWCHCMRGPLTPDADSCDLWP